MQSALILVAVAPDTPPQRVWYDDASINESINLAPPPAVPGRVRGLRSKCSLLFTSFEASDSSSLVRVKNVDNSGLFLPSGAVDGLADSVAPRLEVNVDPANLESIRLVVFAWRDV